MPPIKAPLLIHYAENGERINAMWPAFEAAQRKFRNKYPGTQHGYHNNSTPRFDEPAAKLAWDGTIAHFKKYLA